MLKICSLSVHVQPLEPRSARCLDSFIASRLAHAHSHAASELHLASRFAGARSFAALSRHTAEPEADDQICRAEVLAEDPRSGLPSRGGRTRYCYNMAGLSPINVAIMRVPKRAEKNENLHLHETFVDSGIAHALDNIDNQVVYGRRGTGKTHAFSYLASEKRSRGDISILLDLRTVGSPDGIVGENGGTATDRASRLLIDVLGQLRDSIYDSVLADESLIDDGDFVAKIDGLLMTLTNVEIEGEVEVTEEGEQKKSRSLGGRIAGKLSFSPSASYEGSASDTDESRKLGKEVRRGSERHRLNFGDIARALRELASVLTSRRIWIFIDEWSSVPQDLQPYLAEFLVRCIFPIQRFSVKIAAIEQQSNFMKVEGSQRFGLELGADVSATMSLDDFMVYEGNEKTASAFFRDLLLKHIMAGASDSLKGSLTGLPNNAADLIRFGFTDSRAFDELVRAAEGVPRDFISIAGRAATKSLDSKISVDSVREAAKFWYNSDKVQALQSRARARELLTWIIEKVIREKRARAFLVSDKGGNDPLLLTLFDARVLHVIRRGYSAQDRPGERFDVWSIDYGAYVDLIRTKNAPEGMLAFEDEEGSTKFADIHVPEQDLRAIRRAVLDLDEFRSQNI